MLRTMRRFSYALAVALVGGLLLGAAPSGSAQGRRRVIVVQRFDPFFDPFFPWYGYPYPYPPYYMVANYGEVNNGRAQSPAFRHAVSPNLQGSCVSIDKRKANVVTCAYDARIQVEQQRRLQQQIPRCLVPEIQTQSLGGQNSQAARRSHT